MNIFIAKINELIESYGYDPISPHDLIIRQNTEVNKYLKPIPSFVKGFQKLSDDIYFEEGSLDDQLIVVKWIKITEISQEKIEREIVNLMQLNGLETELDIIVYFHGVLSKQTQRQDNCEGDAMDQEEWWIGIVLDQSLYGSIPYYLQTNPNTSFERRLHWCIQICQIIQYLHEKGFVHRDIKPDQFFLVDSKDTLKIFGLESIREYSSSSSEGQEIILHNFKGSLGFSAPECTKIGQSAGQCEYSLASDVFSLGITITNILTGMSPYLVGPKIHYLSHSMDSDRNKNNMIPAVFRKDLIEIISSTIDSEAEKRTTTQQLVDKLTDIQTKNKEVDGNKNLKDNNEIKEKMLELLLQLEDSHVFNFFDISFDPKGDDYINKAIEIVDVQLINFYLKHPEVLKTKESYKFKIIANQILLKAFDSCNKDLLDYLKQSIYWNLIDKELLVSLVNQSKKNITKYNYLFNEYCVKNLSIKDFIINSNSSKLEITTIPTDQISFTQFKSKNQSIVYSANWGSKDVAIKIFKPTEVKAMQKDFIKEELIMEYLSHPNMIKSFGALIDEKTQLLCGFVFEKCECSLTDILHSSTSTFSIPFEWNLQTKLRLLLEIAEACNYLHSEDILHQDINADNIFITAEGHCKLMNFHLAKVLNEKKFGVQYVEIFTESHQNKTGIISKSEGFQLENVSKCKDVHNFGNLMNELLIKNYSPELNNTMKAVNDDFSAFRIDNYSHKNDMSVQIHKLINNCYDLTQGNEFSYVINKLKERLAAFDTYKEG